MLNGIPFPTPSVLSLSSNEPSERDEKRRDQVLMLDARNISRKVSRAVYDFSPEQQQNIAAIVWLYRGQGERFLKLIESYIDQAVSTGVAAGAPLNTFAQGLAKLAALVEPFATKERNPDPLADPNGDGVNQLLAFATGARTSTPAGAYLPTLALESFTVGAVTDIFPVISVRELIGAHGLTSRIESSPNMQAWTPAAVTLVFVTDHGDGTMTRRWRTQTPAAAGRTFLRLYVTQTP